MEEQQRAAVPHGDLLVEAGRRERRAPRVQRGLEPGRVVERAPIQRRRERGEARVARVEDQQPVFGEDRRQQVREGLRGRPTRHT